MIDIKPTLSGSHAPAAWEPIWYAFPRWSMGTKTRSVALPRNAPQDAFPGRAWEQVEICGNGFPAVDHWIAAGKPLPLDNLFIKLIKKWEFLYYLNYSSDEGFEK
jgi:hypothetical protein